MKRFIAMLLCTVLVVGLCALTATPESEYTPQSAPYTADDYSQIYSAVLNAKKNDDALMRETLEYTDSADAAPDSAGADYVGTNVQINGIDEGDRVKTDGEYIYVIDYNKLYIFKAEDGNAEKLCCVDLALRANSGFNAEEMYVCGDRLFVIGSIYRYDYYDWREPINKTELMVFNIADKAGPEFLSMSSQDGSLSSSRLYDGKLYIVSHYDVYGEPDENDPSTYVPNIVRDGEETVIPCDCICIMPGEPEASYTVLCSYDVQSGKSLAATSVLGGGGLVMMSYENLYVAAARYSEKTLESRDENGRTVKTMQSIRETDICRISLETMSLNGSCTVSGILDGQFAMDEYDGMLRVVSCTDNSSYVLYENDSVQTADILDDESSENALYVFDGDLKLLSSVEGLAKGEYVRSVRFDGEYAYFCTFREIDPLFAVCLADPQNPEIVSEYKISGFSEYLHPWNGDKLFGFGYETVENEYGAILQSGLKLVMFDVSDKRNVTALHTLVLPDTDSEATYDHHAILISAEKNIIGFATDSAFMVYAYSDDEGFTLRASLDLGGYYYGTRGLYINGWIYLVNGTDISAEAI